MARRYAHFASLVAPLGTSLERVVLTPRYAWQLRLASGLNIMLGRDADSAEHRLARFVAAYPETLGRIERRRDAGAEDPAEPGGGSGASIAQAVSKRSH